LAHITQQDRLFFELLLQCNTPSKGLAAGALLCELWSRATSHKRRDELLHALLESFQSKQEPAWCYAVLHVAFYPSLYKIAARFPQFTWTEIHSAFFQSCESLSLDIRKKVSGHLKGNTLRYLFQEDHDCSALEKLGEVVAQLMGSYSLSEILSGEAAPTLDRMIAARVLSLWVRGGVMNEKHVEHVLERYFPSRSQHPDAERQQQTRAVQQLKKSLTHRHKK
jgi:hypothetical protein